MRLPEGNAWGQEQAHPVIRPAVTVLVLGLVFVALVWSGLVFHAAERERSAYAEARRDVSGLAIALDEQVVRTLRGLDQVLRFVQAEYAANPAGFDLPALAQRLSVLEGTTHLLSITDSNGNVLATTGPPDPNAPKVSIADREHFRYHAERADESPTGAAALFVSRPVLGRVSKKWSIQLTRRLSSPTGAFAGVVVVSLSSDYLSDQFRGVSVGTGGVITLVGRDGYVRSRWPFITALYDVPVDLTRIETACGPIGERMITCQHASLLDGRERVYAYRPLRDLPLILSVGKPTEIIEDALAQERHRAYLLGGAITAVLATALTLLIVEFERRRRREAQLRQSQAESSARAAYLKATLDNMDQGLVMSDRDGTIQVANERAATLLGIPAQLLTGQPRVADLPTGELRLEGGPGRPPPRSAEALDTALPAVYETTTPAGRTLEIRTVPVEGGGAVRTLTDITDRKRAEDETERARQQAEAADRAKTEFLASMSHEIRTPLNGVLGYADLLHESPLLPPSLRGQVERIQGAGQALLTVVNDILDFSKIEAGRVGIEQLPFAPRALVDNAVSIVSGVADRKGIALNVHFGDFIPARLVGDQDRLRQVLLNLLNNALKFTHSGSVTLTCEARGGDEGRPAIFRCSVSDTGVGIPQSKRDRLFQRFSQVDASIRREFGGTGLGLAISKSLIELMGGTIGVESREGVGSTFWFEVPLVEHHGELTDLASSESGPAASTRRLRILLVDDVAINQDIACAVLRGAGHAVDVASDGVEAIRAVQSAPYDLVLMDVQMPGMDGITATKHIRSSAQPWSRVPIIAMTANVLPHQVSAFRDAGMNDHVGKPFRKGELLAAVHRWGERQDAAA